MPGTRSSDTFGNEFANIMARDPNGFLRPEAVVQAAQDPNSPLHNLFTWDDDEAAQRYRIIEARHLIQSYTVIFEPLNIKVRGFTSLGSDRDTGGGFRRLTDVMARSDLKQEMLQTALRELTNMESKYQHLVELSKVWGKVHQVSQEAGLEGPRPKRTKK